MKGEYDQLAAVLKSCGIVASHYDATNMAQSINDGVKKSGEYFSRAYTNFQQSGKVDYTQPVARTMPASSCSSLASVFESAPVENQSSHYSEPVSFQPEPVADIVVESAPAAEEEKTLSIFAEEEDALQAAEDILREKEVENTAAEIVQAAEPAPQQVDLEIQAAPEAPVIEQEAPVVAPEPVAAVQAAPNAEELAKKMAEDMFKKMMAEQQAQQQKLQEQLLQQQQQMMKLMQQQAAAQQAAAAAPRPAPQPVEQPRQAAKPQQMFTYPAKAESSQSSAFREVPVDRNKPKATLSKEEMKATDITHWFNFSRK